jgi:drug/metabolite transporter (DMT)-like permease
MEMLCGGVVCAVVALVRGELFFDAGKVSAHSLWALNYLIGPGTLLAMTCYVFVLGKLSPTTVASYAFVNPVVAVVLGALILDERLSGREAIGAAIVVLAVVGLLVSRRIKPEPVEAEPAEPERPGTSRSEAETLRS